MNEIYLPDNGWKHVHCRKVQVMETPSNSAWFERSWDESQAKVEYEKMVAERENA
jgi:hypothetical protein